MVLPWVQNHINRLPKDADYHHLQTLSRKMKFQTMLSLVPLFALATFANASTLLRQRAVNCANPVGIPDSCDFFRDCLQARVACEPEDYPMGVAFQTCTAFQGPQGQALSQAGQLWAGKMMECLAQDLAPDLVAGTWDDHNDGQRCQKIATKNYKAHPRCFVSTHFCTLPPSDWAKVVAMMDPKAFTEIDVFHAGLLTGLWCIPIIVASLLGA
ncbi:hypothetical protein HGRIS_011552 [Hohenbuehelia grisea]|uniref:Uncharacterized protein n=1 Tax=Hohenbuehelia grisea TaxID=104357 RepID=A0ABR3JVF3_9AGAR